MPLQQLRSAEGYALPENASLLGWSRYDQKIYYVKGNDLNAVPLSASTSIRPVRRKN